MVSGSPARSHASRTPATVAGAESAATASSAANCEAMPSSNASRKCSGVMAAYSGRWNGRSARRAKGLEASKVMPIILPAATDTFRRAAGGVRSHTQVNAYSSSPTACRATVNVA